MGGKRVGAGKQVYLYIIVVISLLGSGCALLSRDPGLSASVQVSPAQTVAKGPSASARALSPVQTVAAGTPSPPADIPDTAAVREDDAETHLALGRELFAEGNFLDALKEQEQAASLAADGPVAEEALVYMGLIYAYPANPRRDPAKSAACLKKLAGSQAASAFVEEARVLLAILHENEQSARTIRKLHAIIRQTRQVDMRIEDKRAKAR